MRKQISIYRVNFNDEHLFILFFQCLSDERLTYHKSDIVCRVLSIPVYEYWGISIATRRMNRATGNNAVSLAACITGDYRMKVSRIMLFSYCNTMMHWRDTTTIIHTFSSSLFLFFRRAISSCPFIFLSFNPKLFVPKLAF